eukprot:CAMPEP_0197703244 /NCGR_PEP_ID=MMETSP1338-20131121/125339_1 /TAXON_ID=43686 ORGANISM="Pelagodinium beii, Strain RCC1491" /NCGR_SAMPLE_ID=MMETSP1338 /ASSEMBLY_ACC=CAM_ASM_000754 /LENGTH=387 /DNA_ID=CAMNT_0043287137 /DNA_START=18 /DNA_END=1178 /DNA_ORIENTATION=+
MAGDLGPKLNQIRPQAASWSFMPRESGIVKTKDQPGPGQYPVPSTIYGSHPALPVAGRVPKRTDKRSVPSDQLGAEMKRNPAPHDYEVVKTVDGPNHKFGHAGQKTAPKFTMRPKVSFGSQFKNSKQADEGGMAGDLGPKLNQIRPQAASWSFMPRESGIVKTKDQPGPGQYPVPSTIYGSHPALPVAGRVPKRTDKRSVPSDQLGAEMKRNPAPHDYEVVKTVDGPNHKFGHAGQKTAPKFTMRPKVSFGSQFKNAKQADEGGMAGDLGPKLNQIRPQAASWSFMPRESGIVKTKDQPGPGQYPIPSTIYGEHPQLPVPGRVPKQVEKRSTPSDQLPGMLKNPSPQDYAVVSAPGKDVKFGRADQETAPRFTMRAKVAFGSQFKNA